MSSSNGSVMYEALALGGRFQSNVPQRGEQRVVAVVVGEEGVLAGLGVDGEDVGRVAVGRVVDEGAVGVRGTRWRA